MMVVVDGLVVICCGSVDLMVQRPYRIMLSAATNHFTNTHFAKEYTLRKTKVSFCCLHQHFLEQIFLVQISYAYNYVTIINKYS